MNGPINNSISARCRQINRPHHEGLFPKGGRLLSIRTQQTTESERTLRRCNTNLIYSPNRFQKQRGNLIKAHLCRNSRNAVIKKTEWKYAGVGLLSLSLRRTKRWLQDVVPSRRVWAADGHLSGFQFMGFIIPALGCIFAFAILTVRGIDKLAVSDPSPNLQSEWVPLFLSYSSLINMSFAHISINLPQAIFFSQRSGI